MASEIKVDTIVNAGGDNDTGIDLATNDQILLKVANATKLTMNSTGQTTIVGEGGTNTTSVQQGLTKVWAGSVSDSASAVDSFGISSIADAGTGVNTINFATAFANGGHSANATTGNSGSSQPDRVVFCSDMGTGSLKMKTMIANDGGASSIEQQLQICGDLA